MSPAATDQHSWSPNVGARNGSGLVWGWVGRNDTEARGAPALVPKAWCLAAVKIMQQPGFVTRNMKDTCLS